ncbi:MAG: NADP-dependent oxidoreductase [Actinomycetota bacterium]|nr:NADP-dependent oxidoreductase [Actinomycetota bacterium]
MKAIYYENYGGPEVLKYGDLPEPKVGPDSLLIELAASSVNPVDWKISAGYLDQILYSKFPIIPGWDAAGTVIAKGPAVRDFDEGDEVYGYIRLDFLHPGTFAERIAAPVRTVARKPKNLTFTEAGTVPLTGLTAYQGLVKALEVHEGETIFISAGAGGVGTFAIQIAKALGLKVIASASPQNHDFVRSLGAEAVSYGDALIEAIRDIAPDGIDAFFDLSGGPDVQRPVEVLKDRSRVASITDATVNQRGGRYVFVQPSVEDLNTITALIEGGKIKPIITETYPLEDAAKAFESSMSGHARGKIAIAIK